MPPRWRRFPRQGPLSLGVMALFSTANTALLTMIAGSRFPLLPAFGVVSAVVLAFHFEPFVRLLGTAVTGTSLLAYWLVGRNLNGSRS